MGKNSQNQSMIHHIFQFYNLSPTSKPQKLSLPPDRRPSFLSQVPQAQILTSIHVTPINGNEWCPNYNHSSCPPMLRRVPQSLASPSCPHPHLAVTRPHKQPSPNSTDESADESLQMRGCKQKSQLCKRFMENGYCPYEKRCKFAHGSQQLRRNDQLNSKYKTKECGSFKNQQFCAYGDRCNFIHVTAPLQRCWEETVFDSWGPDVEMEMIRTLPVKTSRLLSKLI